MPAASFPKGDTGNVILNTQSKTAFSACNGPIGVALLS